MPFKISNMYDKAMAGKRFLNYEVLAPEALRGNDGKVVIASLVRIIEKGAELEELGIDQKDIVRLQ
jgi:predicted Ser/Thr protein kinase